MSLPLAVSLLSGGLDSATSTAIAIDRGYEIHALTIDYGQRHAVEIGAARSLAQSLGVARHLVLPLDLRAFGGSALTDDIEVPKGGTTGIPLTYVPARNTVFLSLALAWAEASGARDIFIGVNALDYSGYPDCRPEFIQKFESLANTATRAGAVGGRFRIHAPLIELTKGEIIRLGRRLGVDLDAALTCYDPAPDGTACGSCDSCLLRAKGFEEAGALP